MNPGTLRTKDELARSRPLNGLYNVVEAANSRSVSVDVRIACHLVDHLLVRSPVVGIAAEMRDDEVDAWILGRKHVNHLGTADHVDKNGQAKGACSFTHFARGHGVEAVNLNAAKAPLAHRTLDHPEDASSIAGGVDEGKANQAARMFCDDASQFGIGFVVVTVEDRHNDGLRDPRSPRPAEIGTDVRNGIPRRGHAVSGPGMAVTIDDHGFCDHGFCHSARSRVRGTPRNFAANARYQMLVAIAV